jgi:hypothetical protein
MPRSPTRCPVLEYERPAKDRFEYAGPFGLVVAASTLLTLGFVGMMRFVIWYFS